MPEKGKLLPVFGAVVLIAAHIIEKIAQGEYTVGADNLVRKLVEHKNFINYIIAFFKLRQRGGYAVLNTVFGKAAFSAQIVHQRFGMIKIGSGTNCCGNFRFAHLGKQRKRVVAVLFNLKFTV